MKIATHVAPEELMAFLDGELVATEAQAVSRHIDDCAECAKIADELRRTSQALSAWKVPAVPAKLEETISEFVAKKESGVALGEPNIFIQSSLWTRRQFAFVSVGAVSALLILAAIVSLNLPHERHAAQRIENYVDIDGNDRDRIFDKFQPSRGPAPNGQSKTPGIVGGVPGGVPGGAMGGVIGGFAGGVGSANGALGKLQSDGNSMRAELQSSDGQAHAIGEQVEPAPMIARSVSLSIVVKDFGASRSSLDTILARYHGYSAQLNVNTTENAPRRIEASLRIPAAALVSAMNDLKKLGRVENESQSGEEVTRQHADLVARLKNSRDTEQRLRQILQQRTGKVGEVLEVEQEIARVRGEIESMEAEQKALEHRVDFATVQLRLTEEYKALLNPPAPSVSTRIHNAFVNGYHNATETVLDILLFFAESGPVLLVWLVILASPLLLLWRRYRKMRAQVV